MAKTLVKYSLSLVMVIWEAPLSNCGSVEKCICLMCFTLFNFIKTAYVIQKKVRQYRTSIKIYSIICSYVFLLVRNKSEYPRKSIIYIEVYNLLCNSVILDTILICSASGGSGKNKSAMSSLLKLLYK